MNYCLLFFSSLTAPFLMAYNSTDQVYYIKQYSELKEEFTEDNLISFLDDVLGGRAQVNDWFVFCDINQLKILM